jgi:hypothetical protein
VLENNDWFAGAAREQDDLDRGASDHFETGKSSHQLVFWHFIGFTYGLCKINSRPIEFSFILHLFLSKIWFKIWIIVNSFLVITGRFEYSIRIISFNKEMWGLSGKILAYIEKGL